MLADLPKDLEGGTRYPYLSASMAVTPGIALKANASSRAALSSPISEAGCCAATAAIAWPARHVFYQLRGEPRPHGGEAVTNYSKVDLYRAAALDASAFVRHHLPFGASNKVPLGTPLYASNPLLFSVGESLFAVKLGYQQWTMHVAHGELTRIGSAARAAGHPFVRGTPRLQKQLIETWSALGLKYGVGNCGVQSAMAFVRLRDHGKVFPLDWMQFADADHGFVIVGRDSGTSSASPKAWNDEAICCDPWHGSVEQANVYKVIHGHRIQLMYRLESAGVATE
ncbi:MAG TPA: hypothetical protein VN043_07595 [Rhodanobacter sp.]|nr:hypothetical protein [Rhodanobacter sp.]